MSNIINSTTLFQNIKKQTPYNNSNINFTKNNEIFQDKTKISSTLDASLSALDMTKSISDSSRTDLIAKKVARGEQLTEEEKSFMLKTDPDKLKKAQEANRQREELKNNLKKSKSQDEATTIISLALTNAFEVYDKGDTLMAGLLLEGINKEAKDYYSKHPESKNYPIIDSISKLEYKINKSLGNHKIDLLL